jgi:hypothetical protein
VNFTLHRKTRKRVFGLRLNGTLRLYKKDKYFQSIRYLCVFCTAPRMAAMRLLQCEASEALALAAGPILRQKHNLARRSPLLGSGFTHLVHPITERTNAIRAKE